MAGAESLNKDGSPPHREARSLKLKLKMEDMIKMVKKIKVFE